MDIPNIDLGDTIKVIVDGPVPKWKTITRIDVASRECACRVAKQLNISEFWLFDDLGNKQYIRLGR